MRSSDSDYSVPNPLEGMQPVVLTQQLMQQVAKMQHVDEIFLWLAQTISTRLNIPVVQFWATQAYSSAQPRTELRAQVTQNSAWPQQVYVNRQVATVVERLMREQRNCAPLPVEDVFSPSHAQALAQYTLHYWAGYFLEIDALLPPPGDAPPVGKVATPLNMLVSLFTVQSLSPRLLRAATFLSEQALRIAVSRGFLAPLPQSATTSASGKAQPLPQFIDLVPHRLQKTEEALADSPFSRAAIIPDREARRLYSFIDGRKTIAHLAQLMGQDQKSIVEVLRYLFQNGQIQLYTQAGDVVEDSALFPFS